MRSHQPENQNWIVVKILTQGPDWVGILALLLHGFGMLGKLPSLSKPQFLYMLNKNHSASHRFVMRIKGVHAYMMLKRVPNVFSKY